MSQVPSMNLFSGPSIVKSPILYRPYGTYNQNYYASQPLLPPEYYTHGTYHQNLYNQQIHQNEYQQQFPPYIKTQTNPQIQYQSPFTTLHKYEKTDPTPRDAFITPYKPKILTDEEIKEPVPIIDIILEQQRNSMKFQETGLPKGYAEQDYQRSLEFKYNNELHQQINFGYKGDEIRTKKEIDKFYRNIKVSVDKRGRISINNFHQPEKPKFIQSTLTNTNTYTKTQQSGLPKTTEETSTNKIPSNQQAFDNNSYKNIMQQQPTGQFTNGQYQQQQQQQQINQQFQQSFQPFQQSNQEQQSDLVAAVPNTDSQLQQSQIEQSKTNINE